VNRPAVATRDKELLAALTVLAEVKARCHREDMRTPAVFAALDLLKTHAAEQWPFAQFRRALTWSEHEIDAAAEGRWQLVNASLNAARLETLSSCHFVEHGGRTSSSSVRPRLTVMRRYGLGTTDELPPGWLPAPSSTSRSNTKNTTQSD